MKYMKKLSLFILACICTLGSYADDVAVFNALVNRLLPDYSSQITGKKLPEGKNDYFQLSSVGDKIEIAGNNANSMAVGLNYYLKYYCNTNVSWFVDDHLDMPATLPAVDKKVTVDARCKDRFFLNYCTFGYTMPWWQWEDWEHFIDWMALNGINLPLAITGQESIWLKVWTKLGLSESEVRNYFTGPAHLPWHRMLNIDYWQGNLPMSWLDGQEELQKKIVARERELNMKPVLPAFAGHVPQELKRIYPDAKITKLGAWAGYSDQYACSFLDPMDPLFTINLGNTLSYKNFSLYFNFRWMQGNDTHFLGYNPHAYSIGGSGAQLDAVDPWTPTNHTNDYPRYGYNNSLNYQYWSPRSFLKLKDLVFSYNFDQKLIKPYGIEGLRFHKV